MSDEVLQLAAPGVECTFVAGDAVRDGHLALWRRPGSGRRGGLDVDGRPPADELAVLVPTGSGIGRSRIPVTRVPLAEAIDVLCNLRADDRATPSTLAWARATRAALHLVARGRLLPTTDVDGSDLWRAGPLDDDDIERWRQLADALPGWAHATELPGSAPRRVSAPGWLLARFRDAVVDAYVRTPAAVEAAGHRPFAAPERTPVAGATSWLSDNGSAPDAPVTVALRVEVAADEAAPTDGGLRAVLQIGSRIDPSLVLDAADLWRAPASIRWRFGDGVEDHVLLTVRRAARTWAPAARLLDAPRPETLELDEDEVDELLGPIARSLGGCGLDVLWPAGLLSTVEVTPTVTTEQPAPRPDLGGPGAGLGFQGLCELRWSATVDGVELTDDELQTLVEAKRHVVSLRGRWVRADPERLSQLRSRRKVPAAAALAAALGGDLLVDGETVQAHVEGPLAAMAAQIRDLDRREVPVPEDLRAELRPYQRDGLAWAATMAELGLGGVLADDMGLGKTVQILALHLHRRPLAAGPTLVVCPVSVIANWEREAHRFAPGIPVRRFHGTDRDLGDLAADELVLTTYGVVRRESEALGSVRWGLAVADEAQQVKNPTSRTARALRAIPAAARIALTGTPVENRLVDLWALLDWTTPGLLGPLERFRHEMAIPIERDQDPDHTEMLARLVRPFVLRRRKVDPDIAPDLPPRTESDHVVGLTVEQATLYRAMVEEVMAQVTDAEGMARRGLVLKLLGGLKQICNHPAQFLRQDGPLAGRSGKLDAVTELVDTITDEGDAVLVFTQFVTMGRLLVDHLERPDRPVGFFHGGLSSPQRQDLVDRFQAGEVPVLVLSLKAGGTGLNLTRATHVVHVDRWWNPAVEDQASDRAWRIGQDRPVQVHRMICEGTVEDRIAQLLVSKRELAESVVGSGEGWIGDLGDDDLRALVALGDEGAP